MRRILMIFWASFLLQGCAASGETIIHPAPELDCNIIEVMEDGRADPETACRYPEGAVLTVENFDTSEAGTKKYQAVLEKDGAFTIRDVTVVVHERSVPECIAGEKYTPEGTCTAEPVEIEEEDRGK